MRVGIKQTDDPTVVQGNRRNFTISSLLDRQLWRLQKSPGTSWRSPARFSSVAAREINESGADVVNLHWVTDGLISIEEIGKITIPMVWSMYDMWPFSGTEHYGHVDSRRWQDGYTRRNRPVDESGFDLDRWTFERKIKSWCTQPCKFHMVPASEWLASTTRQSFLMAKCSMTKIPHAVNTDVFAPMEQERARTQLNLPQGVPLVLFLASAGISDQRKGWDLLELALREVSRDVPHVNVIVVGPVPDPRKQMKVSAFTSTRIHWRGRITSDGELRRLYAAADVVAVPSREDNLPLTALEVLSVGCPIVAFDVGGLGEIGRQVNNIFLAKPEDVDDLTKGLLKILGSPNQARPRHSTTNVWSPGRVGQEYLSLYKRVIG